jgi:hypothetical protein
MPDENDSIVTLDHAPLDELLDELRKARPTNRDSRRGKIVEVMNRCLRTDNTRWAGAD